MNMNTLINNTHKSVPELTVQRIGTAYTVKYILRVFLSYFYSVCTKCTCLVHMHQQVNSRLRSCLYIFSPYILVERTRSSKS